MADIDPGTTGLPRGGTIERDGRSTGLPGVNDGTVTARLSCTAQGEGWVRTLFGHPPNFSIGRPG